MKKANTLISYTKGMYGIDIKTRTIVRKQNDYVVMAYIGDKKFVGKSNKLSEAKLKAVINALIALETAIDKIRNEKQYENK